jgi:lipoate-protein ligase A
MLSLFSKSNDPWFNIASEEYLLKNFSEDIFYLYINSPSIIVGKHQNALAEINQNFLSENNVKVVRRISGGGTVYHDAGNLNYCFIKNIPDTKNISFNYFTSQIIDALKTLGVNAEHSRKSDISVEHNKISGNAMHVFKKRVLEHGTLLYNADISKLRQALTDNTAFYKGKAVKSVRSTVANISDFIEHKTDIASFAQEIISHVNNRIPESTSYSLSNNDVLQIEKLIEEKYSTWRWNFGYSPKYTFNRDVDFISGKFHVRFTVKKGVISDSVIKNEKERFAEIEDVLNGLNHNKNEIINCFKSQNEIVFPSNVEIDEFVNCLFY